MPAAGLRVAATNEDIALARALFVEYAQWLKVDLCFQGFDRELATLPGAYAPPQGRLLLAGAAGRAFGCIALRPLGAFAGSGDVPSAAPGASSIGEVKRLYVQPAHRSGGWGRRLAEALIADARSIGYAELKLDTLDWMDDARRLYARLGFRECAAYYDNPLPGAVYMSLAL
jgi:putative acetyltransferase